MIDYNFRYRKLIVWFINRRKKVDKIVLMVDIYSNFGR